MGERCVYISYIIYYMYYHYELSHTFRSDRIRIAASQSISM